MVARWRTISVWLTLLALCAFTASEDGASEGSGTTETDFKQVVDLTDENFDQHVANQPVWMIEVFAQWCSHCRQLEPTWKELAKDLAAHNIRTGKIDGPMNKVLLSRFGINSFPAIFLLKDGNAWEYEGARTVHALKEFALSGHEKASALPFWKAPNSLVGRALGHWHRIPAMIREAYKVLREERGMSDLAIVGSCLAVPVVVGLASICLLDGMYLRQARLAADLGPEHEE